MALTSTVTQDWSGGIYRGRRSPQNAVYDAVNAILNEEGLLAKRGCSAYKSSSDADANLIGLQTLVLPIYGNTVVFWSVSTIYVIDVNGTSIASVSTTALPRAFARGVGVASAFYIPAASTGANAIIKVADFSPIPTVTTVTLAAPTTVEYVAAVGSPTRLLVTKGNKAWFSGRGTPETIDVNDFHELPQNAQIIGADSISDTAILFTTAGMYAISNMALDAVDDSGNIQHQVAQINKDLILWGDPGISSWRGALVVPALEDIYLFSLDSPPQPITGGRANQWDGGIRDLYRSYVKAGYQPGIAEVHRGTYWLPILNGTSLIDVLVCRLDHGFAWTRWSGHAAGGAYAQQVGASTRSPKLYGINLKRVTDLTGTLDPTSANATEADGSVPDCTITTHDYPTGNNQPGTVDRIRGRYELTNNGAGSTPTVAVAYSSDQDAGAFTTLSNFGSEDGGTGGATSDGSEYSWWKVGKRRAKIRYRITQTGAAASFVWRSLEMLTRQSSNR